MWILLVIAALLARTSIANLEAKDIETLPNHNDEDESFDVFTKQIQSSSSMPAVAENNEDEDDVTVDLESTSKNLPNTETETNSYRTDWYKFVARHFSQQDVNPNYTDLTAQEDNSKDDLNSTDSDRRRRSTNKIETGGMEMKKQTNGSPFSWIDWPTRDRILSAQGPTDQSQEKKSTRFIPWGGKRITFYKLSPKIRRPIRVPFNSWGGKRVSPDSVDNRRIPFFNWGGKRVPFNSWDGKRVRFNSWGGKRVPFNSWGGKRVRFNSWGGKRVPFNSWDGKHDRDQGDLEQQTDKRGKFYSWGGKRSKNEESNEKETKRIFSPWGGKRSDSIDGLFSKRVPEEIVERRSPFDAWSNKMFEEKLRTGNEVDQDGVPENEGRRDLGFSNWNGRILTSLAIPYNNEMESSYTEKTDNNWLETPNKRASSYDQRIWAFDPSNEKDSENNINAINNDAILTAVPLLTRKAFFPWGG